MTVSPVVFSVAALDSLLQGAGSTEEGSSVFAIPRDSSDLVTHVEVDGVSFFVHASDGADARRLVFPDVATVERLQADQQFSRASLRRAHQMALTAERLPVRLDPAWSPYHHDSFVAFFAAPRVMGSLRWIAQVKPRGSRDVCFWELTSSSQPVRLERFRPRLDTYDDAVAGWGEALRQAAKRFARRRQTERVGVTETIDLAATTYGAVTGNRSYSGWLERLTDEQNRFLDKPPTVSTRLRGPAGSGKTLLLELKALRELYRAREQGDLIRILFVTHSWTVAVQVDAALRQLDESGDLSDVEVLPLLAIAQDKLPAERQGRGFELLGEDNLSGKMMQLTEIDASVDRFVKGDWLTLASRCSPDFVDRVTAPASSAQRNALVWDLMHEFACVLSAHGILPGVNAARQYLPLHRMPWMMPLETDGEKLAVLEIYSTFVASLRDQRLLSSDQFVNDFLNYLETFAWNLRRTEDGYDIICVDELHLFNEQERLTLHYLSRDPDRYPVMFMALDPRQSPTEVYTDGGIGPIGVGDSGEADAALGTVDLVELKTIHRFSPEILRLVRHINDSFPALDLGDDWAFGGDEVQTSVAETGRIPSVISHVDGDAEIAAVFESAARHAARVPSEERVAIVLIDPLVLNDYAEIAEAKTGVTLIRGRDEVEALQYSRRSIVVSAAEYVAGLQFGVVIVAGFPPESNRTANLGHQRRRLLSLLYLAVSRATSDVEIHVNVGDGGIPGVLESASEAKVVQLASEDSY
ncbi:MAG: hypothetical protein ACRDOS_07245 [Gaiellaceae bacterium]